MTHTITFEPLPKATEKGQWGINIAIAAQLRDHPGKWAYIDSKGSRASAGSTAYAIRTGKLRAYAPAGHYEAKARTVDGEFRVYARYCGPHPDAT
ncbi:hypothetical protein OHA91_22895 [Streptomyces erythrochromogenes]|uniref:Uncharacterized protein n=1 Tax=Streptomyces erythrochromogenes TaxID=285574 RepID=A0ABZ1QF95_9ACTN|nr:hypothetical protein [Streptomyces erythrochromogenes]